MERVVGNSYYPCCNELAGSRRRSMGCMCIDHIDFKLDATDTVLRLKQLKAFCITPVPKVFFEHDVWTPQPRALIKYFGSESELKTEIVVSIDAGVVYCNLRTRATDLSRAMHEYLQLEYNKHLPSEDGLRKYEQQLVVVAVDSVRKNDSNKVPSNGIRTWRTTIRDIGTFSNTIIKNNVSSNQGRASVSDGDFFLPFYVVKRVAPTRT